MNGSLTIWRGSALNCASAMNEINFRVSTVEDQTCNNKMIIGQVIKREDDNYTSQINVILSSNLTGKKIECGSHNGSHYLAIFNTTLDIQTCMWDQGIIILLSMHHDPLFVYIHYQMQFHFHHLMKFR